jgi:hypothetical protein
VSQRRMPMPDIMTEESPNFRTIVVDGVFGGMKGMHLEAVLYSEEVKTDKAIATPEISPEKASVKRTVEARLLMDPLIAKIIMNWLSGHLAQYEKTFGRIPSPEELEAKGGRSDLQ